MFFTQVLRNSAVSATKQAAKQISKSSAGEQWGLLEARRLSRGAVEWAVSLSLILAWPAAIIKFSEHNRWLKAREEYS
ncbi:hypothetical protein ZYGR_0N02860 [Zygosaccharomyces rouxii]|uniref:ZYRO0D06908p n=2 Tax=Zygosaccharomyces rouxii TaxID=4956 RepID=C5DVI1_ZYGRC|nr:uncharacterized protein ZYRO0D06908g [Zygosaccharomyces rouxii]GAV48881.1 hypothetical protein ZYGR_0N02860 [Zygosaccharomyces rouxii]CAR27800.1 ZYRO0D06908p [Zygosaccharomyces rouxii]